jgi:hypothetical protein
VEAAAAASAAVAVATAAGFGGASSNAFGCGFGASQRPAPSGFSPAAAAAALGSATGGGFGAFGAPTGGGFGAPTATNGAAFGAFGAKGPDPATAPFGAATGGAFGAPATGRMINEKQQQQPAALAVNCGTRMIVGRTADCLMMLSEEEPILEVALKAIVLKSQYMVASQGSCTRALTLQNFCGSPGAAADGARGPTSPATKWTRVYKRACPNSFILIWHSKRALWHVKRVLWRSKRALWHVKRVLWHSKRALWHSKRVLWHSKRVRPINRIRLSFHPSLELQVQSGAYADSKDTQGDMVV